MHPQFKLLFFEKTKQNEIKLRNKPKSFQNVSNLNMLTMVIWEYFTKNLVPKIKKKILCRVAGLSLSKEWVLYRVPCHVALGKDRPALGKEDGHGRRLALPIFADCPYLPSVGHLPSAFIYRVPDFAECAECQKSGTRQSYRHSAKYRFPIVSSSKSALVISSVACEKTSHEVSYPLNYKIRYREPPNYQNQTNLVLWVVSKVVFYFSEFKINWFNLKNHK